MTSHCKNAVVLVCPNYALDYAQYYNLTTRLQFIRMKLGLATTSAPQYKLYNLYFVLFTTND